MQLNEEHLMIQDMARKFADAELVGRDNSDVIFFEQGEYVGYDDGVAV